MSSPRRRYMLEFKQEAILLVTQQGFELVGAGRRLGITSNLLRTLKSSFEKLGEGWTSRRWPSSADGAGSRERGAAE